MKGIPALRDGISRSEDDEGRGQDVLEAPLRFAQSQGQVPLMDGGAFSAVSISL